MKNPVQIDRGRVLYCRLSDFTCITFPWSLIPLHRTLQLRHAIWGALKASQNDSTAKHLLLTSVCSKMYIPSINYKQADYLLWHLQLISLSWPKKVQFKVQIDSFLTSMLINFLVQTLQCTETKYIYDEYPTIFQYFDLSWSGLALVIFGFCHVWSDFFCS